jgi:hypothetical protein
MEGFYRLAFGAPLFSTLGFCECLKVLLPTACCRAWPLITYDWSRTWLGFKLGTILGISLRS